MIGAARWSWSIGIPVAPIISGSASTTTYVSAAAKATATEARPSSTLGERGTRPSVTAR